MSKELSDNAASVLGLLEDRPSLNTAALLATHHDLGQAEVEAALGELREARRVRQTPMGWKLPRTAPASPRPETPTSGSTPNFDP